MKKIVAVIIAVIAVAGAGLIFYFLSQNKNSNNSMPSETVNQPVANEKTNLPKESNGPYVGDDFTIVAPPGWIQTQLPSTLVSFHNSKETQPEGSAAAKINFKSYIAVSFDNVQGKTLDEIAKLIKQQTQSAVPSVSFDSETNGTIDGQPAKYIEASLNQQNVDFTVMIAIAMKEDKYFTVSANTTTQKWLEYRDAFYTTAQSFKFK